MPKLLSYSWESFDVNTTKKNQDKVNLTSKNFQSLKEYEKTLTIVAKKIQDLQKTYQNAIYKCENYIPSHKVRRKISRKR